MQNQVNPSENLLPQVAPLTNKTSFLVHKQNKYRIVPVVSIAFFFVKFESSMIMCFDGQQYFISQSLEQIQQLVTDKQFYRLNRQYLINVAAIKEAEHYFARKLKVQLTIPVSDILLVAKEKVTSFLGWLDNR